uniref:Natural killer-tumor recognition protein n=1 Tax=Panagrolaimus sp. PS1159 TaxID=55785 RepID=A0AC35FUU9_9BILA
QNPSGLINNQAPEPPKLETDSQKESKKEISDKSEKSGNEKSEKEKTEKKKSQKKKKSTKKRSTKSHQSKKKEKKKRGEKNRKTQEEPIFSQTAAAATSPSEGSEDGDGAGETLAPCSEKEWEHGSAAYNAALLNVKHNQKRTSQLWSTKNRVTVFALKKKDGKDGKSPTSSTNNNNNPDGSTPPTNSSGSLKSVSTKKLKKKSKDRKKMDKADQIGKIVAGIVRKYLEGKNEENIQIEIKLVSQDGSSTPVIP